MEIFSIFCLFFKNIVFVLCFPLFVIAGFLSVISVIGYASEQKNIYWKSIISIFGVFVAISWISLLFAVGSQVCFGPNGFYFK